MSHLKAEMHQIRFLASVRLPLICFSVCLCLRWSLALYNAFPQENNAFLSLSATYGRHIVIVYALIPYMCCNLCSTHSSTSGY